MIKISRLLSFTLTSALFCSLIYSCKVYDKTYCIVYHSVRQKYAQPTQDNPIPNGAKIAVAYTISPDGGLTAIVYNRTSEIMTIDQTMSFFVNTDGKSTSYYDPTVRTTSTTDLSSKTKGATVNLGSIAGALGIGGVVGQIANGVNVGGSGTTGQSVTNATYVSDQPRVSLAPNSNAAMSKVFTVSALAHPADTQHEIILPSITQNNSHCRFSVCISYSFDDGKTFEKLVTDFYADAYLNVPLKSQGKVNDALKVVTQNKPDLYNVPWFNLWFRNKMSEVANECNSYSNGVIYDYQ